MKKHGLMNTRAYRSWSEAKQRCHNPNNDKYKWYGARGITVCEEWRNDFLAFFNYLGEKPEGYQLDRIDNNRGYEPGNVRWATRHSNMINRRNTVWVNYQGGQIFLEDYAAIKGLEYRTAWAQLRYRPHLINGEPKSRAGENNHNSKLTDAERNEIACSDLPTKTLQEMYGVSRTVIQAARKKYRQSLESSRRFEANHVK